MKKQLKTLGMIMVIGASIMFTTGCSSTTTTTQNSNTEVTKNNMDKERETVKDLLITSEKLYNEILTTLSKELENESFETLKLIDKLSGEAAESSKDIKTYLDKEIWTEDSIEYKALTEMQKSLTSVSDGLQKMIIYLEDEKYSSYKKFTEVLLTAKEHYEVYKKEYKEKLGIVIEKEETENKDKKESKNKKETETKTAICYDCGKYYPVDKMTFNGRSYHCGCNNKYCEECKKEIAYGKEVTVGDKCYLCRACYNKSQDKKQYTCGNCSAPINGNEGYKLDGEVLCEGCYNRIMHNRQEESSNDSWTCPNCGRVNHGEVLCDCEME
ncbi:hypothetical protein [Terrisporobacter mayombei]|uniref:hypothetical protein n=1 Tax=Terrisporobacter mayombei TaxID=1541 RepID=UPI00265964BB|nr:hypothetical protein [Terrisporobacter mayombei]MCC3668632.1 hypothetical protein [Terrisporobacter mayombei]